MDCAVGGVPRIRLRLLFAAARWARLVRRPLQKLVQLVRVARFVAFVVFHKALKVALLARVFERLGLVYGLGLAGQDSTP